MQQIKLNGLDYDKVFFTSDSHFGHKNITRGVSNWSDGSTRDFDTIEQMNNNLVDAINKYVGKNDLLIHLGDWSFGGIDNIWNFRKQLNVNKIIYILGNHDHHIRDNKKLPNCDYYAHELFDGVYNYIEFIFDKRLQLNCMHYPIEEWNNRGDSKINKSLMIHGHQHGENVYMKDRLDVGVDVAFKLFGEYKPFTLNEILKNI